MSGERRGAGSRARWAAALLPRPKPQRQTPSFAPGDFAPRLVLRLAARSPGARRPRAALGTAARAHSGGRTPSRGPGLGAAPPEDAGWQRSRGPACPTARRAPPVCTRSVSSWASRWTRYSFFVAMGYLTICHISRIYIFHYGILTTDFSGPLMIVTQKITTLAFQVHDGLGRRAADLSSEQHRLAVKAKPSFLEYVSYLLNFMSIIAGPCNNFKDYIAFIEGRHTHMKLLEVNWKEKGFHSLPEPSPTGAVMHKLCVTLVSLLLFLTLTKTFPVTSLADDWFVHEANFLTRLCYLYVVMQASKPKYYFAWTLDCHKFQNVRRELEYSDSYLAKACVLRAGSLVPHSADLHPVCIMARCLPWVLLHFLNWNPCHSSSQNALKVAYDIVTWAATQLAVSYTVAPFVMLAVEPTISLYKSMYFYLHIISLLIILFLPIKPQAHNQRRPQTLNSVNKKKMD
ncbi:lysophospholipid acyltransferase 1 isoform X3 [Cervus canadensis]|uniref:lysophospholipid acyltransferase 1 isoform X3 n=1 Tax=Cervus canadensis TaxID=1574408 RepID=UPI001CA362AA|nr:lysophospholipid acyltransferase 1 isoform X3 [Cervus canadensis]